MTGLIHILPVSGVFGADSLRNLYGIQIDDPQFALLLRHRAILFGLLGAFLIYMSLDSKNHTLALVVGLLSTFSFVALSLNQAGLTTEIKKVVTIDLICSVVLMMLLFWKFVSYLFALISK